MKKSFRLPKEFATKWLKALRSGEYMQSEDVLYDKYNEGYCCLGVACVIQGVQKKRLMYKTIIHTTDPVEKEYSAYKNVPKNIPNELLGSCYDNLLVVKLTTMNDTGVPFTQIADWVEQNVEIY